MYIGKINAQNQDLKVHALNRSATQKNEEISGFKKEELRDSALISPVGKKQSLIEQLMKQKQNIIDMRDSKIASAAENGQSIRQDLDEYEQQLKEIDEQISQLQKGPQEEEQNEDSESGIYENPRTKEEAQQALISQLTNLSTSSSEAELLSSVKEKIDGRVSVLKSEVKSGYGNIEKKLEDISQLESRAEKLTADTFEKLQESNSSISDMHSPVLENEDSNSPEKQNISEET